MGFARNHKIGTGMRIKGPDTCMDVIIRGFNDTERGRMIDLEIRGLENVPGMEIMEGERDKILKNDIMVGTVPQFQRRATRVRMYWHAPPEYTFEGRHYYN